MADITTAQKIQREAKKTALRLYKNIYDNLFMISQTMLEMPKEYVDSTTFGSDSPFAQVYDKVKGTLDSMTEVSTPESIGPEEMVPEQEEPVHGEPYELPSEIGVGGEEDLEPVNIEK